MEKMPTEQEKRDKIKQLIDEGVRPHIARQEIMRKYNQNIPREVQTWQKHVADEVLAIAVAIQQHGAEKHNVSVGIDAAVQAAGMAYCSDRAHQHRRTELDRGEPGPGLDGVPRSV